MKRGILIVEDNPDDEELLLRVLRKNSLADPIVIVRDGLEALAYVQSKAATARSAAQTCPFKLALVDIKLPNLGGLQLLREIRKAGLDQLPVVMFSSSDLVSDIACAYREGANGFVSKPMDFDEYKGVVRSIADYWLGCNAALSSLPAPQALSDGPRAER